MAGRDNRENSAEREICGGSDPEKKQNAGLPDPQKREKPWGRTADCLAGSSCGDYQPGTVGKGAAGAGTPPQNGMVPAKATVWKQE